MNKINKVNASIIIIGNEILSGRTQDTNTGTISLWLNSLGIKVEEVRTIPDIEKTIIQNAGGSLFGSKTIIEILHNSGKIPKEIINIFEIPNINQMDNIVILIRSGLDKINKSTEWVKKMDDFSLLIDCKKLKSYEEKAWIKNQLKFMEEPHAKEYTNRITDIFSGNLIAQANEINLLKLTYSKNIDNKKIDGDGAEFLPYELEDKIIELMSTDKIEQIDKKLDQHVLCQFNC